MPNKLAAETSPYLLQHQNNPVDWHPWGPEALERSKREQKPIFLSIGYSTCHWCHVMEHESFESRDLAAVLNEHFVSIKVDREERPDVDRVYMTFVQGTTGSGGWPMSVWLTPDLKPFYGGTYFPPSAQWGRPGFVDVLKQMAQVWRADRNMIEQSAESVTGQMRDASHGGAADAVPLPSVLLFLLREFARTGDAAARDMVLATLGAMALGGMRDHVGGGFHRYSVDG